MNKIQTLNALAILRECIENRYIDLNDGDERSALLKFLNHIEFYINSSNDPQFAMLGETKVSELN